MRNWHGGGSFELATPFVAQLDPILPVESGERDNLKPEHQLHVLISIDLIAATSP